MPSTYSNLKIQLMATGENNTTWGDVTNVNLGTALEEAIVGSADVTFASGNVTLTLTDTNASQTARNMRMRCTGTTGGSTRNLVVPSIEKPYIVQNDCADSILVKTAAGTGITVPAGKTMWVYSDGTNVVDVTTYLTSLSLGGALTGTSANFSGNLVSGQLITTGNGVSTGFCGVEVGGNRTDSGNSYIDLHATSGTDFEARIIRYGGANGGMDILTTGTGGMTLSTGGAGDVVIQTNSTERMRVTNVGNVGIGTSSPSDRLHVAGGGIRIDNTQSYRMTDTAGGNPYLSCQSDNNIVFYSTDGSGSPRPIFSVLARSNSAPFSFNTSITSADLADAVGYKGLPQNSQAGAYTLALADMGKHISNTTGGFVIPANGSVAFPVGATIVLFNNSGSTQTVSITSDTLRQAGTTNTGTRTLAVYGIATCVKVASTTWVISGNVT